MSRLKPLTTAIRRGTGRIFYSVPFLSLAVTLVLTGAGLATFLLTASGDQKLLQRSVTLSSAVAGATTTYKFGFTIATPGTLGSITIEFCSNDPLPEDVCTVPNGFDISGATLSNQTGETGFTISGATTANDLILTRAPAASTVQPVTYTLDGVINPSANGSYYARLQTFATSDASGPETDHGGLAFAINDSFSITAKVPPYLLLCGGASISGFDCSTASGNYTNFGDLSSKTTSTAQTQLLIATNAANGYAIDYGGTTLTSGNNVIPGLASADVSRPATSQFGLNLTANSDPPIGQDVQGPGTGTVVAAYAQPNLYKFVQNDVVATATTTQDYRKYTVSYIANISADQPAGVYDSTITFVGLANF